MFNYQTAKSFISTHCWRTREYLYIFLINLCKFRRIIQALCGVCCRKFCQWFTSGFKKCGSLRILKLLVMFLFVAHGFRVGHGSWWGGVFYHLNWQAYLYSDVDLVLGVDWNIRIVQGQTVSLALIIHQAELLKMKYN